MNSNFMKYLSQIILPVFLTSLFLSCKTNKNFVENNKKEVNIYIAGYEYNDSKFESSIEEMADEVGMKHVVKLWKNGEDISLENKEEYSDAETVFVNNKDVYVAGYIKPHENAIAAIWKNGKIEKLTDGKKTAHINSVFVEDNNVYVLGERFNDNLLNSKPYNIKVWKNGVGTDITDGKNNDTGNTIFVDKGDVYICGYEKTGNDRHDKVGENGKKYRATTWKNGTQKYLTDGTNNAFALSMYVDNGTIYTVGYEIVNNRYIAKLWVNGKGQNLSDSPNNTYAFSIFVYNKNRYIVGYEYINGVCVAKLWINGKAQNITDGKNHAIANSVFVHNNNIYIVGYEKNDLDRDVAKLWINGVAKNLTDGTKNAQAKSIFVK